VPGRSGNRFRVRSSLALLLGVLVLAGCGDSGGPPIDRAVAVKLARQADAIATAGNACAALTHARILQRQTIAAINAGKIPAAYLETIQSRVNELAGTLELRCLPTPPPVSTASTAPPVAAPVPTRSRGRGYGFGRSRSRGHGDEGGD
jgi:hypothetical protein